MEDEPAFSQDQHGVAKAEMTRAILGWRDAESTGKWDDVVSLLNSAIRHFELSGIDDSALLTAKMLLGNACFYDARIEHVPRLETTINVLRPLASSAGWLEHPQHALGALRPLYLALFELPTGDRAQNLEIALQYVNQLLLLVAQDPSIRAETLRDRARIYLNRRNGEHAANVEHAIASVDEALELTNRDDNPVRWADCCNTRGLAYLKRIRAVQRTDDNLAGNPSNDDRAIRSFEEALSVRTFSDAPALWAETSNNLGLVYLKRLARGSKSDAEQAIAYFERALTGSNRICDARRVCSHRAEPRTSALY